MDLCKHPATLQVMRTLDAVITKEVKEHMKISSLSLRQNNVARLVIENVERVERVTHMTSFYQVLSNAFLFELMTGLSVDVVVLHFFQRRKRKIGPAGDRHFCNMHASLYIKDYVNEDSEFGDALRRIRSMVTTNIHLKKPSSTDSLDFIYMDKNHFISRIQKKEKVNSLFAEKDQGLEHDSIHSAPLKQKGYCRLPRAFPQQSYDSESKPSNASL
jgi:hypothetical protein